MAPDILKLDLQLTRGVARDPARQALVRALTWYAASAGSTVVAEGIESSRTCDGDRRRLCRRRGRGARPLDNSRSELALYIREC